MYLFILGPDDYMTIDYSETSEQASIIWYIQWCSEVWDH